MANSNPFLRAHYEKTVLTEQTRKRVQRIYKQAAQDIERRLKTFQLVNPSDSLKKVYLENLLLDIHKSQYDFNKLIESTIINAGEQAGKIAVEAGNEVMRGAGLTIKGAYSYVPHQQVVKIASGQLYEGKWSLSHSIWKNGLRTQSDIQNVVAKGLAENRSVYDIAKDLEKYVDPSARKPWDWNKVYPGTAKQVDYNAQRLARTMIQHSYQACMVESQRYNPFCRGIIWHSVGLHGRTCETCLDRDGNVFPVKDLPLDHPNGLCYFEPSLDSMNDVADRLADWVNGKEDPWLDTYVTKGLGLNPKTSAGKAAITETKKATNTAKPKGMTRVEKRRFIDTKLSNMKQNVLSYGSLPNVAKNYWKSIEAQLLKADDDYLFFLATGNKRFRTLRNLPNSGAYFDGMNSINISLAVDSQGKYGKFPWQTFFHEYGHLVDREMGSALRAVSKRGPDYLTETEEFGRKFYLTLSKDYSKLVKKDGTLRKSVYDALIKDDSTAGVQDIIDGISRGENCIRWQHGKAYWERLGASNAWKQINTEALANMSDAWSNPKVAKHFKKYFPEAYKYFKSEVMKYVSY